MKTRVSRGRVLSPSTVVLESSGGVLRRAGRQVPPTHSSLPHCLTVVTCIVRQVSFSFMHSSPSTQRTPSLSMTIKYTTA